MNINAKKFLLTGTALVAVAAFSTQANAAALTLSSASTWGSSAGNNSTPATDVINAANGDSVTLTAPAVLTITNNGTASSGGGLNSFTTGALTTGAGAPNLVVTTGSAADLTVVIASGALGGSVAVSNRDADNAAVSFTSTGALTVGTTLAVTNNETTVAKTVTFAAGSTIAVTGATTLTGGAFAGANTALTAAGNATFTGATAVNAGAAGNASMTLNGTGAQSFSNTLTLAGGTTGTSTVTVGGTTGNVTGAVAVNAGSGGAATLNMNGTGAQTLGSTLAINGGSGAGGTAAATFVGSGLTVTGATSVTAGAAGTATLNVNSLANVFTGGITLTNGSTAHAALNFTSSAAQTVTGNIGGNGDITLANSNAGGVTLNGTTTAGTIKLDAGAATNSNATFKNTVNSTGGIVLGNAAGTATNTLTLDASAQSFTVTGPISGTLVGQTNNIAIAGGANTVTLANDVGANIDNITVANGTTLASKSLTASGGVTFTGTGLVNGSITAGTTTIANTGALTLSGATGTIGAITAGANNAGVLNIGNGSTASTYTVGGALGANGTRLGATTVANLSTANFSNNIYANTLAFNGTENFTGGSSLTVTSTGATTINGTLNTALTAASNLQLNSDANSITIGNTKATTISAGNQIGLNSTGITFGAAGTTLLINKTAAFDPHTTSVINASIAGGTVVNFATGSVLNVLLAPGSLNLTNGDTITVIDGNTAVTLNAVGTNYGALLTSGNVKLASTGLVRFVNNGSTAQDLLVTANFVNPASVLANQSNAATATSLQNNTTATGNLLTARQNLLNAPTADSANQVAESLAPPADNAAVTAALDVTDTVFSMTNLRLASLRDGSASATGMAAGNTSHGARAWGQGFGRTASQDRRNGTAGYDADTGGVALGMDGETSNGSHLGMAVSYANTDIDSENANRTKTSIDSYQVSVYGDTPIDQHMFLTGMAAYVFNDNETTRHNVGGIAGVNANGQYDANQFVIQAELGRDFKQQGGLTLTPNVMANYSYYDADNYTETGAGTANLNVNSDSLSALNLGVGVDAVWDIENHDGSKLQPSLTAGYRYDVIGDSLDTNSSFTGGGAAFRTQGVDPSRSTFTAGGGLKYYATNNWELSARYNFDAKEDYTAHAGLLRAAYKFK